MAGETQNDGGSRPVPDPTVLTTQALFREVEHLDEKLESMRELLETQVNALGDACEAKFSFIEQRFRDRDLLVDASFQSSKEAVAAALAASKEAVAKSEDTFNKQIAEIRRTAEATRQGQEKDIGGVKDRVTVMESVDRGGSMKTQGFAQLIGIALAIATVVISVVVVLANYGTSP